jgi:hypothetical protein
MTRRNSNVAATTPVRARRQTADASERNRATARPVLSIKTNDKGEVFSHVRQKWLIETPEERVRQAYVVSLHNEYGFDLNQMDEELRVAGRGSAQARADLVIWRTVQDKAERKTPLIVVECKADNVAITPADYAQGEAYALYCNAPFFVTHNNRETRYWRTRKDRMPGSVEEIENIPHADDSDKQVQELVEKLKTFKEDEFADPLHSCHNVIRNREHLDPAAAFDEIAKVLFIKVWVERELRRKRQRKNLFTADWLDSQLGENPLQELFRQTKEAKDADARKTAQAQLRNCLNRMEETKTRDARALLKQRFDYPIFLYEAEKVGITATGEPDANELYPNANMPDEMKPEDTCLELYRQFVADPQAFVEENRHG